MKGVTPSNAFRCIGLPYRSLLMNSQGQIIFSGIQIASFFISSSIFDWSIENASVRTIGVLLGSPDTSYAAFFAFASGTSNSYLSLLHLSDGSIFYQHSYSSNTPSTGYLADHVFDRE